jgi:hypothetical protein
MYKYQEVFVRVGFGDDRWRLPVTTGKDEPLSIIGPDGEAHVMPISRNADGSINIHSEYGRIVRRIVDLVDDVTGLGHGFVIKGDISGKFYFELADAAQAKLDYVSN